MRAPSILPVADRATRTDLVPVRGQRRPWVIGLGVLLASVGALVVVWLVGAAGHRVEVVTVRQEVPYGDRLTLDDLGVVRVSVDPGVRVVPGVNLSSLVGQVATTRLVPGMILAPGMVEPASEPSAGRVLVPLAVAPERMPAGGLRAGDRILAVDAEQSAGTPGTVIPATVVRVGPPDVNGVCVVDVTVSAPDGPALTAAAANGRVALVVQPGGR